MQTLFHVFIMTILSIGSLAQTAQKTVSGTVRNLQNEPVAGATVQLLSAKDSVVINNQITGDKGKFYFMGLKNGDYRLSITAIGQKPFNSVGFVLDDEHRIINMPLIVLTPAKDINLKEVVVIAKRPLVEQEIDKTIVNVGSMISSATSNTLEVLEKTPGVIVTQNGEISLNGRNGVLVLIDGRSTYMSGTDLAAYLKSVPGSLIDKIELIDNPSSRYDAAGNAIIDIHLKKKRAGGYTGSISTGYSQGEYGRNNNAMSLNYSRKKINVFANIGYNSDKGYTDDDYDRRFYNSAAALSSSVSLVNRQLSAGKGLTESVGLDYAFSANTTYGFQLNLNQGRRNSSLDYTSKEFDANQKLDTAGSGHSRTFDKRDNVGTNLNFQHKFGKTGRELSGDLNYLNYRGGTDQALSNLLFRPDGSLTDNNEFRYHTPSGINIYTFKADYVHPLGSNAKFETGFKTSIVNNDNVSDYFDIIGNAQQQDNNKSNHFRYHENINAVYLNTQKSWKKLGAQLGLRIENTRATGTQLGNDVVKQTAFTKDYTQLFPAVFINYKLDSLGKNTLNFSLTRRINRPNYQLMNPFQFVRDKYSYSAGNPLLTPQYQYRYELRYTHKQWLRMTLSYNRFTNLIFQTTEAVDDIFITRPENIARGFMLLLNTGLSLNPAPWWNVNAEIFLSYLGLDGQAYTEKLNPKTYLARVNLMNQLKFKKGWSAEFGGYYASQDLSGQSFTGQLFRANAGVQKKFWKDKASIRLGFEDIFHSWIYHNRSISLKQAQFFQLSESDTQRIGLAFTYRFGKEDFARKRRHNDNASDEEKGRTQ